MAREENVQRSYLALASLTVMYLLISHTDVSVTNDRGLKVLGQFTNLNGVHAMFDGPVVVCRVECENYHYCIVISFS